MLKNIFGLAVLGLVACSAPEPDSASAMKESRAAPAQPEFVQKFNKTLAFPLIADTAFFFHLEGHDSLGTREVRALTADMFSHELVSSTKYEFEEFYKIDSIKAAGKYGEYCDSLDIGQTKAANACAVGRLAAGSSTELLVWALRSTSYEACPYFTTQHVFITVLHKGAIKQAFLLGEYESAGDPPVSMERVVNGRLNQDLTLDLNVFVEQDEDMDQPFLEITREKYRFAVREGRFSVQLESKEAAQKIKRPATP
jgi:hypothetical protein